MMALPVGVYMLQRTDLAPKKSAAAGEAVRVYWEITGDVASLWMDTKTNDVAYVRLDFTFDKTKMTLTGEPVRVAQNLKGVVLQSTMAEANASGTFAFVWTVSPPNDSTFTRGLVKIMNIPIKATSTASVDLKSAAYSGSTVLWTPQVVDNNTSGNFLAVEYSPLVINVVACSGMSASTDAATPVVISDTRKLVPGEKIKYQWVVNPATNSTVALDMAKMGSVELGPGCTLAANTITCTTGTNWFKAMINKDLALGGTVNVTASVGDTSCSVNSSITVKVGDANGDGKTGIKDYGYWLRNFSTAVAGGISQGDFNRNGIVEGLDIVEWSKNYTGDF